MDLVQRRNLFVMAQQVLEIGLDLVVAFPELASTGNNLRASSPPWQLGMRRRIISTS